VLRTVAARYGLPPPPFANYSDICSWYYDLGDAVAFWFADCEGHLEAQGLLDREEPKQAQDEERDEEQGQRQGQQPPEKDKEPQPPTIWYHGGQSYSTDGATPLCVSTEQHNALKSFLDQTIALDTAALKKKGISNVTSVINRLMDTFGRGPFRLPENKGAGYSIRVRTWPAS
jgi:hypothetical protein